MSAHLRNLSRPACRECGALAVCELFNTFNASNGVFCRRHGNRALTAIIKREQENWDLGVRNNGLVATNE